MAESGENSTQKERILRNIVNPGSVFGLSFAFGCRIVGGIGILVCGILTLYYGVFWYQVVHDPEFYKNNLQKSEKKFKLSETAKTIYYVKQISDLNIILLYCLSQTILSFLLVIGTFKNKGGLIYADSMGSALNIMFCLFGALFSFHKVFVPSKEGVGTHYLITFGLLSEVAYSAYTLHIKLIFRRHLIQNDLLEVEESATK